MFVYFIFLQEKVKLLISIVSIFSKIINSHLSEHQSSYRT
jgi:hypothetical protein